ncbi:MAG: response regulator [Gemmatimonadetes bacterium]|nr:response regulator [Gemmatimonadota bacterium]
MSEAQHRVLVVDDDAEFRFLHSALLESFGYEVALASDGLEALAQVDPRVDLIVLDADMPNMNGFDVARMVRGDPLVADIPIVMVTGLVGRDDRLRAFDLGINDFINKPVDPAELRLRARWLVSLKAAQDEIKAHGRKLEDTVQIRTRELREALAEVQAARLKTHQAHMDTIHRLTLAGEYKDRATADHVERIGRYSQVVARWMKQPEITVETIRHAAPMHDVGKLGIPDRILLKPGKLDEEEWAIMRTHTTIGAQILADSQSEVIQMGERIALSHHERWDGKGYPQGIAGAEIPLEARICTVVDVFDALTVDRPYRKAIPNDEVIGMMAEESGTHFDRDVFDIFLEARPDIEAVQADYFSRGSLADS